MAIVGIGASRTGLTNIQAQLTLRAKGADWTFNDDVANNQLSRLAELT